MVIKSKEMIILDCNANYIVLTVRKTLELIYSNIVIFDKYSVNEKATKNFLNELQYNNEIRIKFINLVSNQIKIIDSTMIGSFCEFYNGNLMIADSKSNGVWVDLPYREKERILNYNLVFFQ